MPSSSRNRSKGNNPPPQSIQFPTAWGAWVWNDTWNQYYRYRQVAATGAPSDFEYEYQQSNEAPRNRESNLPTTLAAITDPTSTETSESTGEEAQDPIYTTDPPIDSLNAAFRRTNLYTVNEAQTQIPASASHYKVNYAPGRARSDNFDAGPSNQRPRGGLGQGGRFVRTEDPTTNFEPLNPNFTVRHSSEFVFGKVFKVLWSEPTGSTGTEITGYRAAKYGEKAYHSIRRFLVVDERHPGHSICLPILTYGGRGTTKKGVRDSTHAIIFTGKGPSSIKGEKMSKSPIRMVPESPQHHLDAASRINYAKLYTVEHNVKVQFIGWIAQKYEQQVTIDYNKTHPILPDRPPYEGESRDDDFTQAQGSEPRVPSRKNSPQTTVVSTTTTEENKYDDDLYDVSD